MTKFLTELITDKTPILNLEPNTNISKEEKIEVIGVNSSLLEQYIKYMYYKNNYWYYFKKDEDNGAFPFYIIDELMGTYLAKKRNLPTVSYEITQASNNYGLASVNFKNKKQLYYNLESLLESVKFITSIDNIEILKNYTINELNEQQFMSHLFNLFALDIHMLQKDRGDANLQFQIDKETNYFDIAPLYDYSNCSSKVGLSGINVMNKIIRLDYLNIEKLARKYPEFRECLELCLEHNMKEIFEQICLDYKFNQDCSAYERVKDYYEIKDESQKQYIKELLVDIKK